MCFPDLRTLCQDGFVQESTKSEMKLYRTKKHADRSCFVIVLVMMMSRRLPEHIGNNRTRECMKDTSDIWVKITTVPSLSKQSFKATLRTLNKVADKKATKVPLETVFQNCPYPTIQPRKPDKTATRAK